MIHITVSGTEIYGKLDTKLTSGSVGRQVEFTFDADWEGLLKTVVFRVGSEYRSYYMEYNNMCEFPWELLTKDKVGQIIHIGVCGMRDNEIVFPTMYTYIGELEEGADPAADPSVEHSPELVEQLISIAENAEDVAQSVRDDADAGKFNGKPGPQGPQGPKGDTGPTVNPDWNDENAGSLSNIRNKPSIRSGTGVDSVQTGFATQAIGDQSFAQGYMTIAKGNQSHAEGHHTIAGSKFQHVDGKFNIEDTANKYAQITGCGAGYKARKNIRTMDWYGNVEYAGDVVAMGCDGENPVSLVEVNNRFEWKLLAELVVEEPTTTLILDLGAPITDWYSETLIHLQAPKNADNTTSLYPAIQVGKTKESAETITNYPPYLCNGQGISLSNKYDLNVMFKTLWLDRKRALYTEHIYENYDSIAYAVHNFVSINMFDRNEWYAQGMQFISIRDAQKKYIFPKGTILRIYGRG